MLHEDARGVQEHRFLQERLEAMGAQVQIVRLTAEQNQPMLQDLLQEQQQLRQHADSAIRKPEPPRRATSDSRSSMSNSKELQASRKFNDW